MIAAQDQNAELPVLQGEGDWRVTHQLAPCFSRKKYAHHRPWRIDQISSCWFAFQQTHLRVATSQFVID